MIICDFKHLLPFMRNYADFNNRVFKHHHGIHEKSYFTLYQYSHTKTHIFNIIFYIILILKYTFFSYTLTNLSGIFFSGEPSFSSTLID